MRTVAVLVALTLATTAYGAEPYLFDLLDKKPYRIAWDGLLSVKGGIPDWVLAFSKTYVGVATPSRIVRLNGADYRFAFVCKPHDCAGNELKVLFGPSGNPAWALLIDNDRKRWLGDPDEQIRRTITELSNSEEDSEEGL
jgi:hypothetical protein